MEIRDYLRMLRRGWLAIVLITALFVGATLAYLAVAPKRYDASTTVFVTTRTMGGIDDLQQGSQFAKGAAVTYAEVIDSATVLGSVAPELRPQLSVEELEAMVTVTVRPATSLIDIGVSGPDRERVAIIANEVGEAAVRVIQRLERNAKGDELVDLQLIREAIEPVRPGSPNVKRTLAVGLVVGLCVGLAVTLVAQTLDNRIRRVQEVRQLADVPLLATLPRLRRRERQGLVVREHPSSAAGEAFRALRTNISFLESKERRSLLITAVADDRDGAQVSANLAWTLAQTGKRILLVDLDLRHTTVADTLGLPAGEGMTDVLAGGTRLIDVIRATDHPYLSVVLSGTAQSSPSELLSAPAMALALSWMERHYDHVILHAPPLLSYTDAAVVSVAAGSTLVTLAAGGTQAQQLTTALLALANVRVKPLGLVLTHVQSSATDRAPVRSTPVRTRPRNAQAPVQPPGWEWAASESKNGSSHPVGQRGSAADPRDQN